LVKKSISGLACQIIRYIINSKNSDIQQNTNKSNKNMYVDLLVEVPQKWSCINVWRSEFKRLNLKRDAINALIYIYITDGAGNWYDSRFGVLWAHPVEDSGCHFQGPLDNDIYMAIALSPLFLQVSFRKRTHSTVHMEWIPRHRPLLFISWDC